MNPEKVLLSFKDGIAIINRGMNAVFANPALSEILQISIKSGGETAAKDMFSRNPEILEHLEAFFADGTGYVNYDFPLNAGRAEKLPVELSISSVDYGERDTGACVVIKNREGRREIHREIEKEEKMAMLSMMAAGLAHEIKNPLGGIKGAAQLIGRKNESLKDYCKLIESETDRVNSLVSELLDLGTERKKKLSKINIHRVLEEVIALQEPLFMERGISIARDYDPSLPALSVEPDRVKQVFVNLMKNAMEVMTKGQDLRIRTRTSIGPAPMIQRHGKKMMMAIEFRDSGKGIDPEIARHLFTPFNTSKRYGTGLGLVMSLKIIRDHGGTLTLENNHGTPGATARIILPLA